MTPVVVDKMVGSEQHLLKFQLDLFILGYQLDLYAIGGRSPLNSSAYNKYNS